MKGCGGVNCPQQYSGKVTQADSVLDGGETGARRSLESFWAPKGHRGYHC